MRAALDALLTRRAVNSRFLTDPAPASIQVTDQQIAAGAAAMNLLNAAHLLGYAGLWLPGESCHDPAVTRALGLKPGVFNGGWRYPGTASGEPPAPPRAEPGPVLIRSNSPV